MGIEEKVSERYAGGAKQVEESLCCPVDYDASLLKILPQEIIEKDYGCGDPSRYVKPGDCVLDLGSGGGKICFMAAQLVGKNGEVIGIDMTDEMLALARKYQAEMSEKTGGVKIDFRKGYIQDLALDVQALEKYKKSENPSEADIEHWKQEQKQTQPLVSSASVDLVVSNCVLNLVAQESRSSMISEIFRVLKPGGRIAISDIVSNKQVPEHLQEDALLWSGCISGAFQEQEFLKAFLDAGFVAIAIDKWDEKPWQVIEGIEFRAVTITAIKPDSQAITKVHEVMYKGPYQQVVDDMGNTYVRGQRVSLDNDTYQVLLNSTMTEDFTGMNTGKPKSQCC